jgi:hypothetical protein
MKKSLFCTMAGILLLANTTMAAASGDFIPPFDGQHQDMSNGSGYYSGGVGITEREQMKDMTQGCNLKLVFDTQTGAYLSAVNVKIQDAKGNVLIDTVSVGPWFTAKLPAADYRITASFANRRNVRTIQLAHKPRTIILSWTV